MKLLRGKNSVIWHSVSVQSQSRELRIANTLEGKAFPGNAGDVCQTWGLDSQVAVPSVLRALTTGLLAVLCGCLFPYRGCVGREMSFTLSALLCPDAEEFVVVSCPANTFRITRFPPWPNDVFPRAPTVCSLLYCSLFIGCESGKIHSAQSSSEWWPGWRSWVVTLLHWSQAMSGGQDGECGACPGLWHRAGMSTTAQLQQLRRD